MLDRSAQEYYADNASVYDDGSRVFTRDYVVQIDQIQAQRVYIESQGHLFKVRLSGVCGGGNSGGRRGVISEFSRQSRKRLLDKFARLNPVSVRGSRSVGLFLTLTYPGEYPSPIEAKRDLDVFLKRVRRRFPGASGVWRLEFQKRGAPHFHIILFGCQFWHKSSVQRVWGQVIGYDQPFTRIERLRSWRGVLSYVAKYVGKDGEGEYIPFSCPIDGGSGSMGLTISHNTPLLPGRFWGLFNVALLPFAEKFTFRADFGSWVYDLRRLCRRAWSGMGGFARIQGFTRYCDNPKAWFDVSRYLGASLAPLNF